MSQPDDLHRFDQQQAADARGTEALPIADVSAVLDWLTDEISALESNDLNSGGLLTLVWLKAKRRELNARWLALSEEGDTP